MSKTKFGTLTIVKKMLGNTEIVKEVLNGITIYEASTPPAPLLTKGDIIHFDALGDGTQKRFRVIKVDGVNTLLMSLDDDISSDYNYSDTQDTFDNGNSYQKYAGGMLDYAINTTYYNSLSVEVKAAIVATNRIQSCYSIPVWSADNPDTSAKINFHRLNNNKYEPIYRITQKTIGDRNCFALDIDDIIEYFEISDGGIIEGADLMQLFKETSSIVSDWYSWLTSAFAENSTMVFRVNGGSGALSDSPYSYSYVVRPAFLINLSTISYTKE